MADEKKPVALLLDSFPSWQKAGGRHLATTSRTPASARADKIFNDPDSWGSGDGIEDFIQSPPFFFDDVIHSGTFDDTENPLSSYLMRKKSAVQGRHNRSQNSLTIKPFENKFHLQKRPSFSSDSDTSISSAFVPSRASSATSIADDMDSKRLPSVKPKWESVRDDVADNNQSVSLSPILADNAKLQLDSITGRMSLFWQQQNIFRAVQTPKGFEFELGTDGPPTPWTANSDFWKGKRVLDNFEKSMQMLDDDEEATTPLTRVGRPKHKRTRTPPSIGPLTISTTTTTTTTTTKTVVTLHSPVLGTPASVTVVSASTTWSILELYGASPTSPKRKMPMVPKTSGPLVTTFTPPSPQLGHRSSLPKSAFTATFGFVDPQELLRVPGSELSFSSPKIVELPDNFVLPDPLPPNIKAAPVVAKLPAPRAPLTISIPDPKHHLKPKNKKSVRPLPKLPSSPPPPVPAIPDALPAVPVLPPIPKHSPLPLPVTPALSSISSASSSSSSSSSSLQSPPTSPISSESLSSVKVAESVIPQQSQRTSLSGSSPPLPASTLVLLDSEASDMKMKKFLRSSSSESKKSSTLRSSTPPPSKADKLIDSEKSKPPPVPSVPPVPSLPSMVSSAIQSQQFVQKETSPLTVPSIPLHTRKESVSEPSRMPASINAQAGIKNTAVGPSPKSRPPELQPASLVSVTPPSSSALSSSAPSSLSVSEFKRTKSPSISVIDSRRSSDAAPPTPRVMASATGKRQTSLQIPMWNVPFPDPATLAMRRNNRSASVSSGAGPSSSPVPTPPAGLTTRKPSFSSTRPNLVSVIGRTRKESGSVASGSSSQNDASLVVPSVRVEASSTAPAITRHRKISSSSSQFLAQASIIAAPIVQKAGADGPVPMRKSPPPSKLPMPVPEVKVVQAPTTGKTHSRTPSAVAAPSIPIPPVPSSFPAAKSKSESRPASPVSLAVSDTAGSSVGGSLSRTPSRRKNSLSSSIPQMNVPNPSAATLARRVTKKNSFSNPNRSPEPPMPSMTTLSVTETETQTSVKKQVSFTVSSALAFPPPPKTLKRVSSTPTLRSSSFDSVDVPLPDTSSLLKRMASKGVTAKVRPPIEDRPSPVPPVPAMPSTNDEAPPVPIAPSQRQRAAPLPNIFYKPGTGKSDGKEQDAQKGTEEKERELSGGAEEEIPRVLTEKAKGKQKELLPVLPVLPAINLNARLSRDSDEDFEKELDQAVSFQVVSSGTAPSISSSSLRSESVTKTLQLPAHKKAPSVSLSSTAALSLPDLTFKKPIKESIAAAPVASVSLKPVAAIPSSKSGSESARKRLSTVAPIITTDLKPKSTVSSGTVPPLNLSKHSRSKSLSSTRIPLPKTMTQTPPVPSLPQLTSDLNKSKQSSVNTDLRESDGQTVVIPPRRSRSPTRPTTPGGPRLRSKSVTGTRVPLTHRLGSSSDAASVISSSSSELGLPLVPPPPLGKEERGRSASPVTPGSRGRVSPFPSIPKSAMMRISFATAA